MVTSSGKGQLVASPALKLILIIIIIATPNSQNLHSTNTEKLQKHKNLKEEPVRIWKLKTVYIIPLVLSTAGIISHKLHHRLKLLNFRPALHILMQKTVVFNTCCTVRKFLTEQRMSSTWAVRLVLF